MKLSSETALLLIVMIICATVYICVCRVTWMETQVDPHVIDYKQWLIEHRDSEKDPS